jgi:hypothetical protein
VQELLDELWDSECTPEEVCGACPELLPDVRRRWRQMCAVKAQLDALFPASGPDTEVDWSEVASVDPTNDTSLGVNYYYKRICAFNSRVLQEINLDVLT